jgi:hypothetical protein
VEDHSSETVANLIPDPGLFSSGTESMAVGNIALSNFILQEQSGDIQMPDLTNLGMEGGSNGDTSYIQTIPEGAIKFVSSTADDPQPIPVPEPFSPLLLGAGLIGLGRCCHSDRIT